MPGHVGNSDPAESNRQTHHLPSASFLNTLPRKSSQRALVAGENISFQHRNTVPPISPSAATTSNSDDTGGFNTRKTRSTDVHGRQSASPDVSVQNEAPTRGNWTSSARTPWTPGFERAMNQFEPNGSPSIRLPHRIEHGRPGSCISKTLIRPGPVPPRSAAARSIAAAAASNSDSSAGPKVNGVGVDLSSIRESIESTVERQVADALAPLRFIVTSMHGTVTATAQENADFHEQNNTLSRQLDLQYHQIRQHSENTSSQISALLHLIETQSTVGQGVTNSLNILNNVASQLTHAVTNVPHFVGNLVQSSVAPTVQKIVSRGTQTTLDLAISAERQIDSISNNHSEQSAQLERQWDEISNQLAVILQEIRHQPQRLHSVEMESLRQDDVAEDEVKQNKRGVLQEVELSRKCGSRDVKFFFKKLLKIVDRKMERMASSS